MLLGSAVDIWLHWVEDARFASPLKPAVSNLVGKKTQNI